MYEVAASPDRVTSSDVARAAGVSRTTVSYVFNGRGAIPDETRTRVRAVADGLGYRPSGIARALRTGTTDLVVLVLPAWSPSDVLGRLIRRMSMRLEALGLPMVVTQVEPESVGLWAAMTPLAILSPFPLSENAAAQVMASGARHLIMSGTGAQGAAPSVADYGLAHGRLQMSHLVAMGHTRCGYAMPEDPVLQQWFGASRVEGAGAVCADHGLPSPIEDIVSLDADQARNAVRRWLDAGVTAVAAYNDDIALAVIGAAHRLGVQVPGELAVIGMDNTPISGVTAPTLTTVEIRPELIADDNVNRLLAALGRDVPASVDAISQARVIVRGSA